MVGTVKSFLVAVFVENRGRKVVALILAAFVWLVVNQSLTTTRSISNIPVRVINVPAGETIEGMQSGGRLSKKLTLTLVGNKTLLGELTPYDFEVVLDASDKPEEWIVSVAKKNLISLNPEIDLPKGISRLYHPDFVVRMAKLATDQISVVVTQPTGEAPRGYQFLDVWPYRLKMTVSGPEAVIKRLKAKEQRITFNLSAIQQAELETLATSSQGMCSDVVSFPVPNAWKQVSLLPLSQTPLEINDPEAAKLRIDFIRCHLLPLDQLIPLQLFFPQGDTLDPRTISIQTNPFISEVQGVSYLRLPLYVNGVDRLFLQIVRNRIQILLTVPSKSAEKGLDWSVQFIHPNELEDLYVAALMADVTKSGPEEPLLREEYLRNRFRNYMYRFQLLTSEETKFELSAYLQDSHIDISCKART